MPESAYERARKFSGTKSLNHTTGKYEHRDENWVIPEGHAACPSCDQIHPMEAIKQDTWFDPRTSTVKSGSYCPDCG